MLNHITPIWKIIESLPDFPAPESLIQGGTFVVKNVFDIAVGDIVSVYNQDFVTEQVFNLSMGRSRSINYKLRDGREVKWLCVRKFEQELLVLGEEASLETETFGQELVYAGHTFNLVRKGSGRAHGTSEMGYPRYINLEYYDYEDPAREVYLFVQKADSEVLAYVGEPIIASGLEIYPKA
jgi:hypothetical protein